jgi:hypothetical protein
MKTSDHIAEFWHNIDFYTPSKELSWSILRKLRNNLRSDPEVVSEKKVTEKRPMTMAAAAGAIGGFFMFQNEAMAMKRRQKQGIFGRIRSKQGDNKSHPMSDSIEELESDELNNIEDLQLYLKDELYGLFAAILYSKEDKKRDIELGPIFGAYFVYGLDLDDSILVREMAGEFEDWLCNSHGGHYQAAWGGINTAGTSLIDLTANEGNEDISPGTQDTPLTVIS